MEVACAAWLAAGARWLGGCCGTTPAAMAALRSLPDHFMEANWNG
jgi:S-methylmethionine-dependent homocysteine/selenocysteine methylase